MENFDYNVYVITSLCYEKKNLEVKKEALYPFGWFDNIDYKAKSEILAAAINEDKLIDQTDKYKEYLRGKQK